MAEQNKKDGVSGAPEEKEGKHEKKNSGPREPYHFIPVDTPEDVLQEVKGPQTTPRFESMADIMKEFHRGTWWEVRGGEMAELAIEDTHAKITNYYVLHDRAWTHGAVVDFIDMDEGTGSYTVYALCTDGTVLAVPEEELDDPVTVTYGGQKVQMVRHLPKEVQDTAALGRRILAEKDRTMAEYEKNKKR